MSACVSCLARGALLRGLAPRIDRAVDRGAGRRARDLLALGDRELARAMCGTVGESERALAAADEAARRLPDELAGCGCWAICAHDPRWPPGLGRLGAAAPRALFGRGDREELEAELGSPAVTVVGARRAGAYGNEVAAAIAGELAAAGVHVISGMAFGVDTAAHRGALEAGGRTSAVLGAGPERPYPRTRARLYAAIHRSGRVLSELPPGSPVFRWSFPARNRLMAAIAEVTVVVEAAERSGSLITAEMAADCGRTVGAVPGPVNSWRSAGTNALLAEGAALIRDGRDVVELIFGAGAAGPRREGPAVAGADRKVLDAVEAGAASADELAIGVGLNAASVAATLSRLELAGYLELGLDGYRRSALPAPAAPPAERDPDRAPI